MGGEIVRNAGGREPNITAEGSPAVGLAAGFLAIIL
jgi:hypothetical protein